MPLPPAPANPASTAFPAFRSVVPGLLSLMSIFFANFMTRVVLAPFLLHVREDFDLTKAQAGELFLILALGYSAGLMCSGFFSSRLEHRRVIVVSALGVALALGLAAISPNLSWLRSSLLLVGLFGGLYFPSGFAVLTSMVPPTNWGKAIAIHELAPNLSFVLAPLLAELMSGFGLGWRSALAGNAVLSIVAVGLFLRYCTAGREKSAVPRPAAYLDTLGQRHFWILAFFFAMAIGATQGVYSQTPLYLVSVRDLPADWVNYLLAASRVSGLFLVFWAGMIVDRLGPIRALRIFVALTGITTMTLGLLPGGWVMVGVLIQPTMGGCFFPAGFAVLSMIYPAAVRPLAISLVVPMAVLAGGGLIPAGLGIFGDHDHFALGFILLGGVILLSAALTTALKSPEGQPFLSKHSR
ncbi:MAG: MFS transporter [Desulfovibrionales bacterium]|nr:MAG: MFS transporter [Desulfovibrionales bacterium]